MDDVSPDCEVLLLDDEGRTKICYIGNWISRDSAVRTLESFAPLPYRRYEIWRGLDLVAANEKDKLPVSLAYSARAAA